MLSRQAKVSPETYAVFTNWVTDPTTEVRLMSLDTPNNLSDPVKFTDLRTPCRRQYSWIKKWLLRFEDNILPPSISDRMWF